MLTLVLLFTISHSCLAIDSHSLVNPPWLQPPNLTVAQDASGDFMLLSDAVAAAPNKSSERFIILVKQGIYHEYIEIGTEKLNLVLVGEGMEVTTISGNRSQGSGWATSDSATFIVRGERFTAVNIGFENTAGAENEQAVALQSDAKYSAFFRCKISGYQDTLLANGGYQFFRECNISGTTDFIFGFASAMFQACTITARKNLRGGKNEVTAHGRSKQEQQSGFSFQFCNIVYEEPDDNNPTPTYLGRPWRIYSRTVFMQCYMGKLVTPEGWDKWNGQAEGLDTLYYGEYMNHGPGAELWGRVKWPGYHIITDSSVADEFTVAKFIDGNSWLPATQIPYAPGLLNN